MAIFNFKGLNLKGMFGGVQGGYATVNGYPVKGRFILPQTNIDYQSEVGTVWLNGAVNANIQWIQRTFTEAPVQVEKRRGGVWSPVEDHALAELVRYPNQFYGGDTLWKATLLSYFCAGNAYWRIVRNKAGIPVQLWYVPHWQMFPMYPTDGSQFISHYVLRVDGEEYPLKLEDVVHFRNGLDPHDNRLGLSPIAGIIREIYSDNQMGNYYARLFKNAGIPSVVICPDDNDSTFSEEQLDDLEKGWKSKTKGDNLFSPFLTNIKLALQKLGFSPKEMEINEIGMYIEARVCSAFQISPMVTGLMVGLQHSTNHNKAESEDAAYRNCIKPTQKDFAEALQLQLLPQLGDRTKERVCWDYADVYSMQEDTDSLFTRWQAVWESGGIDLAEYRDKLGLDVRPEDAGVYFAGPLANKATTDATDPTSATDAPSAAPSAPSADTEPDAGSEQEDPRTAEGGAGA